MHGNHVPRLAGTFLRGLFMFVVARAGFPLCMLVALRLVVACADGAVRVLVFLMGVALGAGFPFLVLVVFMAVVRRAGGAVLVFVFRRCRLLSACGIEAENGSQAQDNGKIETFHVR